MTDEGHTVEENMTARGGAKRDIAGQRFGRLTAQRRVPPPDGAAQNDYWLCRCDCGNERTVLASNLLRAHEELRMSEAAGSDRAAHQYADSAGEIGSVCYPRKAEGAAVEVPVRLWKYHI